MVQKGAPVGLTRASSQVTSEVSIRQTEQSIVSANLTQDTPTCAVRAGMVAGSGRDHPCSFVNGYLSSFRLRSLTGILVLSKQIISYIDLSVRCRLKNVFSGRQLAPSSAEQTTR